MTTVAARNGTFSLRAFRGDAKTLLAFNFATKAATRNLAGFTIKATPKGTKGYYLFNELRYENPADHAQVAGESPKASINAPIHKFRWVHVPGQTHQGLSPRMGDYTYTVTPRFYDDNNSLMPLDPKLSASVTIEVNNFSKGNLTLGFARGYTQSQAFVNHFTKDAKLMPDNRKLVYDTSAVAGKSPEGVPFTYADAYQWLGFTARARIFELLDAVKANKNLVLDVFAYDLNEPDLVQRLLTLGRQKRVRIILDNASLHHRGKPKKTATSAKKKKSGKSKGAPPLEDDFEKAFVKAAGPNRMLRGHFGRFAHDKVFIVSRKGKNKNSPIKVMTGSTNFSVTGIYVNSNHILIYDDPKVAGWYADVFQKTWDTGIKKAAFAKSNWANNAFTAKGSGTPKTVITFSPHDEAHATQYLDTIVNRIQQETKRAQGSVLFAVMTISAPKKKPAATKKKTKPKAKGTAKNPVYDALRSLHSNAEVFSFGISDSPGGTYLYPLGKKTGVLVSGKPSKTNLPPPFNQVPNIAGFGHQIHHKFVICGFRGPDPVVFCGSSNLAWMGEQVNGDNLLAVYDDDVVTAFAIEALLLVDHFNFLDSTAKGPKGKPTKKMPAVKQQAADQAGWFIRPTDKWAGKYYDPKDLHCVDRQLFA
ncbi:MAG: hypothetical protein JSR72_09485 [Proteobacteria bacterium]|nr:hypothetical protein [Pseudomonadota bacterium]